MQSEFNSDKTKSNGQNQQSITTQRNTNHSQPDFRSSIGPKIDQQELQEAKNDQLQETDLSLLLNEESSLDSMFLIEALGTSPQWKCQFPGTEHQDEKDLVGKTNQDLFSKMSVSQQSHKLTKKKLGQQKKQNRVDVDPMLIQLIERIVVVKITPIIREMQKKLSKCQSQLKQALEQTKHGKELNANRKEQNILEPCQQKQFMAQKEDKIKKAQVMKNFPVSSVLKQPQTERHQKIQKPSLKRHKPLDKTPDISISLPVRCSSATSIKTDIKNNLIKCQNYPEPSEHGRNDFKIEQKSMQLQQRILFKLNSHQPSKPQSKSSSQPKKKRVSLN